MAAVKGAVLSAGLLAFAAIQASAQEAARQPEFEAVSIKPFVPYAAPGKPGDTYGGGPCRPVDPGRLSCRGTSI